MVIYTSKLNLYKPDPQEDGESTFNIDTMLNENWDKIDQNAGETNDKLGDLSQLQTTDKSSLVNANNEIKNNLVTHLNDYTQFKDEMTQPDTLTTPKQISSIVSLPNTIDGQASVGIEGRTYSNLLSDAGNCEDLNKWVTFGIKPTIDTTIKLFGESSFKTTPSATSPSYIFNDYNNTGTKYYLVSAYAYLTSNSGELHLSLRDVGSFTGTIGIRADTSMINSWQRIAAKAIKTDGFRLLYGRVNAGETLDNFDGIMVNEITEDEYNNLTVDELMQKYPYISGAKSTTNTRIKSIGKNLFDKNNATRGTVGATGVIMPDFNSDYGYSDFIPVIKNQNYTKPNNYNCAFFNENKIFSRLLAYSKTITAPENGYIVLNFDWTDLNSVQLEEGPAPTPYEPYKESISYITLPEGVDGLHSLPNGVKDEVTTDGDLIKRISKTEIDSSGYSYTVNTSFDLYGYYLDQSKYELTFVLVDGRVYEYNASDNLADIYTFRAEGTDVIIIRVPKGTIPPGTVTIIYQLAESQIYDLAVTPITCFKDGTIYIESAADDSEYVVPETQFTYPINTAAVIQSNVEGINELGNTMNLKANRAQEAWIEPTLLNGWVNSSGTTDVARYMKDNFGFIHLKGTIESGAQGTSAFILPVNYRAKYTTAFVTSADGITTSVNKIQTDSSGNVFVLAKVNTIVYLDGISFKAGE